MLISCPECNRQISSKAFACPGCGLPMTKTKRPVKATKRMRLPNGFGSISEVSSLKSYTIKLYLEDQNIVNHKGITPSATTKVSIKQVLDMVLDYGVEIGVANINESRKVKLPKYIRKEATTTNKEHIIYTDEEIDILWNNTDDDVVKMILIQCYSGWRPSELCNLLIENIDLDEDLMIGGMKTDNGKDRTVPIHRNIKPLIESLYNQNNETLCNLSYDAYRYRFTTTLKRLQLNPEHRLHDARKHFITLAKKYNLNEYAIKRIVGHSIRDLTERVYTERDTEWLKQEISKIL